MKKKSISLLICLMMVLSFVAGCGSKNTQKDEKATDKKGKAESVETSGQYEDFITVDVFNSQANYQGIQQGWFAEIVKEKFNMELNIIAPNVAGGGDTLFQTRSAAGNLGDLIVTGSNNGRLQDLITAELIIDMTDLMKDKENIKQYQHAVEYVNNMVKEDGMWAIPSEVSALAPTTPSEGLDLTFGPYLRWDLYKEIGYPEIGTLEDLLPVLKQMQDTAGTSDSGKKAYAFSFFKDWDGNMMNNAKQPTCLYGYDELGFVLATADGSDYQSIIDSDSMYMRVLKLFFDANQMGLVDPESTTQNYDVLYAKYQDGGVLYSPWPWLGQAAYNTTEHKTAGKGFMIAPIKDMNIFSYGCTINGNANNCMMIGSKAKDPQRLADFIDWLYSPEGITMSAAQTSGTCGPEGLTWEMKDGEPVLTDFGKIALIDGDGTVPEEWGGGSWKDGVSALNYKAVATIDIHPEFNIPYNYTLWDSVLEMNETSLDLDWQEKMGATTTLEYLEGKDMVMVAPGSGYAEPEESSEIETLRGQCRATIVDNSWKMIFAKDETEFNTILKDMQDTVIGLEYEKVLEVDMQNSKDKDAARKAAVEAFKNQ